MSTFAVTYVMSAPSGYTYRGVVNPPIDYPVKFEPMGLGLGGTFSGNQAYVSAVVQVGPNDTYM